MLTRELIASGGHLNLLKDGDRRRLWSEEQLEASLAATLAKKPSGSALVWVFAYGSLIWNPMILYDDRHWATLTGWRRRFSLRMTLGRGSEEHPGRMLAIEPGAGSIRGVVLSVQTDGVHDELRLLWRREMLTGAYAPEWVTVTLDDGRQVDALIFASNPGHPHYEEDHSVATVAPLIAAACGPYGSNAEYVLRLHHELHLALSDDADVDALADALLQQGTSPLMA